MKLAIPEFALDLLLGPEGEAKACSTSKLFHPSEGLSLGKFRGLMLDEGP